MEPSRENGEAGLSDAVAGEVEALLAASEQAAEALTQQAQRGVNDALADLTTLVAELRDTADRLEERLEEIRAGVRGEPPAQPSRDVLRRARLVAFNMAANGASRAETARYLSELGVSDREALLDSVYASLGSG